MPEGWQFVSANAFAIISLLVAAITAIGVFLGPKLVAKWQREKERQDRELRIHFEDLERITVGLSETSGDEQQDEESWDVPSGYTYHQGYAILEIGKLSGSFSVLMKENSEDFKAFEAHFPEKAMQWKDLKSRINEYIGNYNNFVKDVKKALEERLSPLPILDEVPKVPLEYADIRMLSPLFQCWLPSARDYKPRYHIEETSNKSKLGVPNYANYTLEINGSPCVFTKTYDEAEKCKACFVSLRESAKYIQKASEPFHIAKELNKSYKEFGEELVRDFEFISKYGIGKKFKICKERCPVCQKILEKST